MRVNLLPYHMTEKKGPNWPLIFTLAGIILLAAVTFIFYTALQARIADYEVRIADMRREYEQYTAAIGRKDYLDQLQALVNQKQSFIDQLSGHGVQWNLIMDELRSIIPKTVVLDTVRDNGEAIEISGHAGSLQAIAYYMENIDEGRYVTDSEIHNATWSDGLGAFLFKMTCRARGVPSGG